MADGSNSEWVSAGGDNTVGQKHQHRSRCRPCKVEGLSQMWNLYDQLIATVPVNLKVKDCLAGLNWFLVRSRGVGVAMRPLEGAGALRRAGHLRSMKLRDLAAWVKSWNAYEAAMGLAAINSAINAPEMMRRNWGVRLKQSREEDVFTSLREQMRGKKVAVIGHFQGLERLAELCRLSILERRPQAGDLPDWASEYVLDHQDVVIMTASALINKTLPRLLALSEGAQIVLAGPSTPMHPLLFDHGVHVLGGLLVEDDDNVWHTVAEGGQKELFSAGSRVVTIERA